MKFFVKQLFRFIYGKLKLKKLLLYL